MSISTREAVDPTSTWTMTGDGEITPTTLEIGPATMSPQINRLAAALAKAQGTIRPALKDATNPHFKSKYADLSAIWEACQKVLPAEGLAVMQFPSANGSVVTIQTMLAHESGQWAMSSLAITAQQATPQGIGSAITYGRRYGLAAIVGVVADEDDDGNAASGPKARPNAITAEQRTEIERLAGLVGIAPEDAAAKAELPPLDEMQSGQGMRLIGLLTAKLKKLANAKAEEPKAAAEPDRAPRTAEGEAIQRLKETLEVGGLDVKKFCAERGIKRWSGLTLERLEELITEAEQLAERVALQTISEREAADLRSLFQAAGIPPAEWLMAHGVESGMCEACDVATFNLAVRELTK